MKTKLKLNKRDFWIIGITLLAGFFFGWLFFHGSKAENSYIMETAENMNHKETIWTCSMHPQVRMDHPGKCPICGMDLIPLQENSGDESAISPDEIQMTKAAMKIANIQTMVVQKAYAEKEIYLLGKIKPDERNIAELTARFGGRIEKLYINFTGQNVKKGEKLATIYSPALVTAQKELLEAQEYKQTNPDLYKAARNKFKLWDITDEQIEDIEKGGEPQSYFNVLSPITGTVTKRYVTLGDYVKEGNALFQVVDLTGIWIMFEAYESDLPWLKTGDVVNFTIQSVPGENFTGQISFIDPLIDPKTRVARVRVEVPNPGLKLKPDMFVNGIVTSNIDRNKKELMIPKTAVLWTGKRAVVYIKIPGYEQPVFRYREIVLGPSAGDFYIVNDGLIEGEEIAVNGVFKIDAAAQLAGKTSMMNPEGGNVSSGHNHGN
jgi:Cu(I)/Ag(I) efflux system membrane fusion protein